MEHAFPIRKYNVGKFLQDFFVDLFHLDDVVLNEFDDSPVIVGKTVYNSEVVVRVESELNLRSVKLPLAFKLVLVHHYFQSVRKR